jgi:RNA polymerase sigma-70 factor (ECF subfamily)
MSGYAMASPTPDSAETYELLEQASAGDRNALEQLFCRYRPALRRFIELRLDAGLRQRVDASDVVQEAELEAYRRLQDFLRRRPMPFALWLRKTAYERLLKARRHAGAGRRAVACEVPLPDRSSLFLARHLLAGSGPGARLDRKEAACRVRQAVASLPELDRQVVVMRNFDGLSNPEIGLILGLEPAAVSQRHGRALLRLRQLLLDAGLGGSQP